MTRGTKSWWIVHVAAGVAAVALVAFGMTQCSGKNDARDEAAAARQEVVKARQEVVKAGEKIDGAVAKIDSLVNANRGLSDENRAQADTIRMQRDSIAVLNDSLAVVNDQLIDCRSSKKQPVKKAPVKKEPVKKEPVKVQPKPAAKDTVVVVVKEGAKKCATPTTVVELDDSKNTGNIVVSGKCGGTQVKLENGSVNNGNIVVGNNNYVVLHNQVVADTLARYAKTREIIVECEIQTTRRVYK